MSSYNFNITNSSLLTFAGGIENSGTTTQTFTTDNSGTVSFLGTSNANTSANQAVKYFTGTSTAGFVDFQEGSTAGNSLINFGFIAVVIAILTPL